MEQPITTNPLLIAFINMTVVFAVLYGLSLIVRLTKYIDPTQKKKKVQIETSNPRVELAAAADSADESATDYDELCIVFTAALAAYEQSGLRIVAISSIGSSTWSHAARMEATSRRSRMVI